MDDKLSEEGISPKGGLTAALIIVRVRGQRAALAPRVETRQDGGA